MKLVPAARPNLSFYSRTPAPPCCIVTVRPTYYIVRLTYDISYDIDKIVSVFTVLANRSYNIVYEIVYNIIRPTPDIVYYINKKT